MAFHISEFRQWDSGPGSPPKYSASFELDCELESQTDTEAVFRLKGVIEVINYPKRTYNSWAASDFAVLTLGGFDPIDYPFTQGISYYQAPLPALPNAPQSYKDAMLIEFRGDIAQADGPNRVSLWTKSGGVMIDATSTVGTYRIPINTTFTLQLTGTPQQEVLIYTHSGVENRTEYMWLSHDTWAHLFNFDYRPGATWNGVNWMTHNRSNGSCNIFTGSTWETMRTENGGQATDNPPYIAHSSTMYNQRKVGVSS